MNVIIKASMVLTSSHIAIKLNQGIIYPQGVEMPWHFSSLCSFTQMGRDMTDKGVPTNQFTSGP